MRVFAILACLLMTMMLWSEEEKPTSPMPQLIPDEQFGDLPASVQRQVGTFKKKADKAFTEYLADVREEQEDLFKVIDKEVQRRTKAGDLEGALALRTLHDNLAERQVVRDFMGNVVIVNEDVAERAPSIVGKWQSSRGYSVTFNEGGSVHLDGKAHSTTWAVNKDGTVRWINKTAKVVHTLTYDSDKGVWNATAFEGKQEAPYTLTPIKEEAEE